MSVERVNLSDCFIKLPIDQDGYLGGSGETLPPLTPNCNGPFNSELSDTAITLLPPNGLGYILNKKRDIKGIYQFKKPTIIGPDSKERNLMPFFDDEDE